MVNLVKYYDTLQNPTREELFRQIGRNIWNFIIPLASLTSQQLEVFPPGQTRRNEEFKSKCTHAAAEQPASGKFSSSKDARA